MLKSIIKGFSLLELVVVLAVMGTLAAVAVPAFSAVTSNSSDGALESSATAIAKQATSIAQSDSKNPGRGPLMTDFGDTAALKANGATANAATNTVTVWGQKDKCVTISIGAGTDAKLGTSDDVIGDPKAGVSSVVVAGQATVCTVAA